MNGFSCGIATGFATAFVAVAAMFGVVGAIWPDRLPPPAISSLAVIDEKLRFLRERPGLDPDILAVGSSITWRQLSGEAFADTGRFLNGGMVKLKTHHTSAVADLLLDRYRNVDEVVTLVSLPDFEDCTDEPLLFDSDDAQRYAFEGWPSTYFYLRYFDLHRYVRTARTLVEKRVPLTGELYMDDFGSGPIQVPSHADVSLRYGDIRIDPSCIEALVGFAENAARRGIGATIVLSPIHPDYRRLFPASLEAMHRVREVIRSAAAVYGTRVLSLFDDPRFTADDFYDAFHLQWNAVDSLSRFVAQAIQASQVSSIALD